MIYPPVLTTKPLLRWTNIKYYILLYIIISFLAGPVFIFALYLLVNYTIFHAPAHTFNCPMVDIGLFDNDLDHFPTIDNWQECGEF